MIYPFRFLLIAAPCFGATEQSAIMEYDHFTMRVKVIEALESGPLTLSVTLSYSGDDKVEVFKDSFDSDISVIPSHKWTPRELSSEVHGDSVVSCVLARDKEWMETIRVHHSFSDIRSGSIDLEVKWNIYAPSADGRRRGMLIANLSAPLKFNIPRATPERLADLRQTMTERLLRPNLSDEDRRNLVFDILDTRHHVLASVAWTIITSARPNSSTGELIEFVSECPDQAEGMDARLAQLAVDPNWPGVRDVFNFWRNRKTDLAPAAWKTLTEAESVWPRALTYVVFSKRCAKEWKESLLQDLRDQGKPLPSPQFQKLLVELDEDDFAVREKASYRLARFGERVEAQLRHAVDGPLSAEARTRATEILTKLEKAKQPPDCLRALDYLAAHEAPENGEVLQVLADGEPDAWLTHQAKIKLAEWRKARGLPEK